VPLPPVDEKKKTIEDVDKDRRCADMKTSSNPKSEKAQNLFLRPCVPVTSTQNLQS